MPGGPPSASCLQEAITICMCTFRRESAFEALHSFAGLEDTGELPVEVLVIDNDETNALQARFEEYAAGYALPMRYVHAPARNISIARNAALSHSRTRWLAFIDDDEVATPEWLKHLAAARARADVAIGRCEAVYGSDLPAWVSACDFHSNRIKGNPTNAYTSNALIDRDFLVRHGIQFRIELGRTGGEDTIFFREIAEAGGRIIYCPEAVVYEDVPEGRANMQWVRRRMFRAGQTHGLLCREFDKKAYSILPVTSGAKVVFSAFMAAATIPGSVRSRRWYARAALHAGAIAYWVRPELIEEYA